MSEAYVCSEVVVPQVQPGKGRPRTEIVAMIHVPCTTAILNTQYTAAADVAVPSTPRDIEVINRLVAAVRHCNEELNSSWPMLAQVADGAIQTHLRSLAFLLCGRSEPLVSALAAFEALPFVNSLVERARVECTIYCRHGIRHVEVENVGAPYFVGAGKCPIEELAVEFIVLRELRSAFPHLCLGIHVLSSNELEALPIALCHGVAFVRSESTVFGGMRPEGPTTNSGNLARFLYVRNALRASLELGVAPPIYPQVWSDLRKKHTVFPAELQPLEPWLHNIGFIKMEGVIITGPETGSNVKEEHLRSAREAIDAQKAFNRKNFTNGALLPSIPLVTGSGTDFPMYCRYADYMIVGTALKEGSYWENPVSEPNVKATVELVDRINGELHD